MIFHTKSWTLEREKLDSYRYRYFILDEKCNEVKNIDSKYYNCRQIGKRRSFRVEEEELDNTWFEREYDTSFRYFEFTYDFKVSAWKEYKRIVIDGSDNEIIEIISETEAEKHINAVKGKIKKLKNAINLESDEEVIERYEDKISLLEDELNCMVINDFDGDIISLKAIFDDNGDMLAEGLCDVVSFTGDTFIVKLPNHKGSKWEEAFDTSFGKEEHLWAVLNLEGDLLFKPERAVITFDNQRSHPLTGEKMSFYFVGDLFVYDGSGKPVV